MLNKRKIKFIIRSFYIVYLLVLFLLVTCKIQDIVYSIPDGNRYIHQTYEDIKYSREIGIWNYNLVPFQAYSYWTNGIYDALIINLLGNIVAFMPMGFFEMVLSKHRKLWKVVLKCFIIVTCLELFQFITCLGYLDIDDITMNTFGCLLGCLGFYLLAFICRKAKNFFTN